MSLFPDANLKSGNLGSAHDLQTSDHGLESRIHLRYRAKSNIVVATGLPEQENKAFAMSLQTLSTVPVHLLAQPRAEITGVGYRLGEGASRLKLRAATAGCIPRQWSVGCSPGLSLRGHEYRVWLKNRLALYGVKNAMLTSGYRSPDHLRPEAEAE